MKIEQKINLLDALLARAINDVYYGMSVSWGQDKEVSIAEMKSLLNNAKLLFSTGRINSIDYEERIKTVGIYNKALNSALRKFPDIYNSLEPEEGPKL